MRICIPAQDAPRLDTRLSPHFGRAPHFVVVDSETGEMEMIANEEKDHDHGHCVSVEHLATQGIDAVVCGGMGRRSLARFEDKGLGVFISRSTMVWEVLAEIRAGDVTRLKRDEACAGGHHHD